MALQTLFLEIYIAMLCINGGVYMTAALAEGTALDVGLISPFTSANVTAITQPNIYNSTSSSGTLVGNQTTLNTINNSTIGGDSGILNPIEALWYPIAVLWTFVQFITGGFVFSVLGIFGLPAAFTYVMQGVMGLLLAINIIYYTTGR